VRLDLVQLVAVREYLRTVKRRGYVVGTLLLPLGLGGLLALSMLVGSGRFMSGGFGPPPDYVLLVVDESALGLEPEPALAPHLVLTSRESASSRLGAGEVEEYYIVPSTYPDQPIIVRVQTDDAGGLFGGLQRQAAQQAELSALLASTLMTDAGVPVDTQVRVLAPTDITAVGPDGQPVSEEPNIASFLLPFGFTMLFVLSIFITSGYLLQSVTEEKENRVVEIVLSSIPALPLMAGKIIGLGGAGLTQVVVWILTAAVAILLFGQSVPDVASLAVSPVVFLLGLVYFALGYLAYGAIFSAVGAVAPGSREAQQYAGFFGFLAVIPLIFTSVFLTDPSSPVVIALALFPFTTAAAMLLVLTLSPEIPWLLVVASLASLTTFAFLATVASARVFRATLLLYGVRPSMRNIVAAVFARA
jgi:ABC-2 type transport system permease protein